MANTRVQSLFVLTLLQLCRAEILPNVPEWYSANIINDGYQPKPLSEIFSTESPFSTTNPIVVLPKSTAMPEKMLSTTVPPSSEIVRDISKTSIIPFESLPPFSNIISTTEPLPITNGFSTTIVSETPNVEITQYSEYTQPPSSPTPQVTTITTPLYTLLPELVDQTSPELPSSPKSRFLILPNESEIKNTGQTTFATIKPLSDFVVYENNPQISSGQGGLFESTVIRKNSSLLPEVIVPDTLSSFFPLTVTTQKPTTLITEAPITLINQEQITLNSQRPTTLNLQRPNILNLQRPTTLNLQRPTTLIPERPTIGLPIPKQLLQVPSLKSTRNPPTTSTLTNNHYVNNTLFPHITLPLRIRVISPKGSITHVNINPPPSKTTTTTKKPTTRKTLKPRKNTYEACLNGCKVRREPICAIPLSATWINQELLKGFPSICHMACFNSYKKEAYEKFMDGRCGRLRTRIQSLDSKRKLRRDELNKSHYVIDNGDQTVVEVSSLSRSEKR